MTDGGGARQDNKIRWSRRLFRLSWLSDILLVVILLVGFWLRLTGITWGEGQFLHPDERFLVWVTADIQPVNTIGQYFDTAASSLNPHNVGHRFFVYGTFPIFLTRYLVDVLLAGGGWEAILVMGRSSSAIADLLSVFVVFLIGRRLWNQWVGLLGAAFSALAVLQIQQAHFYTSDSFATFFSILAVYFAVCLATIPPDLRPDEPTGNSAIRSGRWNHQLWLYGVGFGIAAGLAAASKIHVSVVSLLLPATLFWRWTQTPKFRRHNALSSGLTVLLCGTAAAFIVFRFFQPYAFEGPAVWDILPNPLWIENLKSLLAQTGGEVDFPPALQWARRPVTFSLQNMVLWGMGLPMGILAWAGFIWLGWRLIKSKFSAPEVMLWGWSGVYFGWQSLLNNPTMRYQLPIYPLLAVIAGWSLWALYKKGTRLLVKGQEKRGRWVRFAAVSVSIVTLLTTAAWAYSFSRIYTRPVTRVEASRWIYQNVPAAVNLLLETEDGDYRQPLPYEPMVVIQQNETLHASFRVWESGLITQVNLDSVVDLALNDTPKTLVVNVFEAGMIEGARGYGTLVHVFGSAENQPKQVVLDFPLAVEKDRLYSLQISFFGAETAMTVKGGGEIVLHSNEARIHQPIPQWVAAVSKNQPQEVRFQAQRSGLLQTVEFHRIVDRSSNFGDKVLGATLYDTAKADVSLAKGTLRQTFVVDSFDPRGAFYQVLLEPAVRLEAGHSYTLRLELLEGDGELAISPASAANETVWDDGLPLRLDGYDPYGGLYPRSLNFDMYVDDNDMKRERFISLLNQVDYIYISSNRQWGTIPRLPERYPLTSAYYRYLLGCPPEKNILWCYRVAEPGMFSGQLGFDLVAVFQSNPNLGPVEFNTQFSEEAFTVYDHPKVLIFKKSEQYDPLQVQRLLNAIDLRHVIHVLPGKAQSFPANLMLPTELLDRQRSGGTWSELFDSNGLLNRFPGLGWLTWYAMICLVGWLVYPISRIAMKGLPDRGYPLAKIVGLLLWTWGVWLAGSAGIAFSRLTIGVVLAVLLLMGGLAAFWQRDNLLEEWRQRKRYFVFIEIAGLLVFVIFTLIRVGNPDLWHPAFGGEKPMDFAYFNAVIRSTIFPPYNPWFSGMYINYYYFGFVIVALPTKWLGIMPAIAYNLLLPAMAAMFALGAFSAGWNLVSAGQKQEDDGNGKPAAKTRFGIETIPLLAGSGAAAAALLLGNLGTVRMIWHGLMRLAMTDGTIETANLFQKISWTAQGLARFFGGARLPYSTGDWYWIPSRALPGEAITEFPFFTFLYADPHAHLFALPLTMLALGWCLSVLLAKWQWGFRPEHGSGEYWLSILIGALAIGVLRPTNTWDMPTYLGLGVSAILYSALRNAQPPDWLFPAAQMWLRRLIQGLVVSGILVLLSFLLFEPYNRWYALGYGSVQLWQGARSPVWSYLTHWGVFYFVIASWLVAQTIEWMATTPFSALRKLKPHRFWIFSALGAYLIAVAFFAIFKNVEIAFIAITLAAWCLVLLLRPNQPDAKRAVLFIIGTAVVLTFMVELIVLVGDIGRMNTVFKFYLQAWNLLAVSAAVCALWLLPMIEKVRHAPWMRVWQAAGALLLMAALLYPLTAGPAKIRDRMSPIAPIGLDGMAFMRTAEYSDQGRTLDLSQDYRAIRWMQENVHGSPVIVEANTPLYRWGSRFSIYTGLPTIIGWDWHQRQQRAAVQNDLTIQDRINDVADLYNTQSLALARRILDRYEVKYIIVGQLEQAYYEASGLSKFPAFEGQAWKEVYRDMDTAIYKVIP
ncbi:MAG: DUF2298 domain-containing protein [Bellilinea sp.]|jgi:YYY domain-containing protein